MAEQIQEQKKLRKAARRAVTSSINTVKDLILNKEADNRSTTLKGHLALLRTKMEKLETIEERIICLIPDEEVDDESTNANQYCLDVNICIAEIESELKVKPKSDPQQSTSSRAPAVKLPKVNIEPFSGDLTAYPTFIDAYESIIHANKTLSNVEKFYYLKGLLKGKAANTIEGLSMTNDNYDSAIHLIKSRYGCKKRLQSHFIDALMKLKPIDSTKELKGLRILHDKIESITRNLKTLGIDDNTYGPLLMPLILQKLPSEISLAITKSSSEDSWDFQEVIAEFEQELSARERCQSIKPTQETRQSSSTSSKHRSSTFHAQTGRQQTCSFCKGNHSSWQCDSVTDVKQRRKIVMNEKLCFNCLRTNHQQNECKSKYTCRRCNGKHHSALCESATSNGEEAAADDTTAITQQNTDDSIQGAVVTTGTTNVNEETVLLKTAIVEAVNPVENTGEVARGRILFDDASTKTYITEELSTRMKLKPIYSKKLVINGACNKSTTIKCPVVQLDILTMEKKPISITASVLTTICRPLQTQHLNLAQKQYSHLKTIQIADMQKDDKAPKQIDILIGGDFYYSFMPEKMVVKRAPNGRGPVAIQTQVGWVVSGPIESSVSVNTTNLAVEHALFTESIINKIDTMWDLDTIGIKPIDETYESFAQDLKLKDGRYEVSLPWKKSHQPLPDNYRNSLSRLKGNLNKLKKNPAILTQYNETIGEQISTGVVERRHGNEPIDERLHYLPHHGVVKEERSTTKLRIVYDASSKVAKHLPSVNDCLMKGPSLNPLLFDVLLRFRIHQTAFICDIMKGFLQILVKESDRDALRFLWVDDPFSDDPEVVIYRFTRVVFGLNCSPFLFSATLREHFLKFKENNPDVIEAIMRSLYVDDFVGGGQDTQASLEIYKTMNDILMKGGFKTHKFVTNDSTLEGLVSHPEDKAVTSESYAEQTLGHDSTYQKVLGTPWDSKEDNLIIEFQHIVCMSENSSQVTRRIVLSLLASLFDPLGLVSPVSMKAKVIFQEACRRKLSWDAQLPRDLINEFTIWLENLKSADSFIIPRCYVKHAIKTASLIGFSDASQIGYSAVVYLHFKLTNGRVQTMLVTSKARVAPLKGGNEKTTIPRLELIGCLILSRLMDSVKQAFKQDLKLSHFRYYTDSLINLHRIKGQKQYKQFVENRIAEIRTRSDPKEWYFVPGEFNAADLPSRGGDVSALDETWIKGPKFIQRDEIQVFPYDYAEPETDQEEKSTVLVQSPMLIHAGSITPAYFTRKRTEAIEMIIDPKRYSSLQKLLRVTAYVMRFTSRTRTTGDLTTGELEEARTIWVKSVQHNESKSNQASFKKTANNLRLEEDEKGVLRCRGRLSNADLAFNQRHPIYMPVSQIAKLIVLEAHARVFHQRTRSTLTQVRSSYWIPQGRRYVASILKSCYICKLLDTNPYPLPSPPNLPEFRVEFAPAFTNIGTDHVGPFYARGVYGNRKLHKCYVSIYSCCVTRAIHIELQPTLEAPATIRAMKRAFARQGTPKLIVSDNHKTYKATSVQTYARNRGIEWRFILPRSPHWGGFYERMNGLIKRALNKSLRNTQVSYEEFETILIEIESMINSRPLCYVYEDDMTEPLTPSHLIYGRRLNSSKEIRPVDTQASILDDNSPSKRVRYMNSLLDRFWERFRSEYLTSLRERETTSSQTVPNLKVGDVVLVKEENVSRMEWPLGRVIRLVTSDDNVVRGAILQTKDGVRKRPVTKLCPLEIQQDDSEMTEGVDTNESTAPNPSANESNDTVASDSHAVRVSETRASELRPGEQRASSTRAAARTGQLLRRIQDEDEEEEDC